MAAIGMVTLSIQNAGNASVYIGSAGLLALMLTVVSFVMGLSSLLEESYKLFPVLGSWQDGCHSMYYDFMYKKRG